jgi:hypothetical protein
MFLVEWLSYGENILESEDISDFSSWWMDSLVSVAATAAKSVGSMFMSAWSGYHAKQS